MLPPRPGGGGGTKANLVDSTNWRENELFKSSCWRSSIREAHLRDENKLRTLEMARVISPRTEKGLLTLLACVMQVFDGDRANLRPWITQATLILATKRYQTWGELDKVATLLGSVKGQAV